METSRRKKKSMVLLRSRFFDNVLRFFREKKKHIKISACSEFCFYSVRVEEPAKRVACCLSFLRRFFPQTAR